MTRIPVLELRNNRRLGWLMLAVSVPALGVGYWGESPTALAAGALGLLIGLWNLLDRRVKLRVDEVGILYARWGETPIQWSEIEAIETRKLRGVEHVAIVPSDPALVLQRMSPPQRLASWIAARGWSSRFVLSTAGLERGTAELLGLLRRYHAARSEGSAAEGGSMR